MNLPLSFLLIFISGSLSCITKNKNKVSINEAKQTSDVFIQTENILKENQRNEASAISEHLIIRPDKFLEEKKAISKTDIQDWFRTIILKFAPILYLNDGIKNVAYKEPYLLSNVENFFSKAGIKFIDPKTKKETVCVKPGEIDDDYSNIYDFECAGRRFKRGQFVSMLQAYVPYRNRTFPESIDGSKCYVTAKFIDSKRTVSENIKDPADYTSGEFEISYMFWYPYNGNPIPNNRLKQRFFEKIKLGHHEGDWEHLVFRISFDLNYFDPPNLEMKSLKLKGVHYAAHGGMESVWYKNPANPLDNLENSKGYKKINGRFVGFIASQSHATYNRVHNIKRFSNKNDIPFIYKTIGNLHILPSERTNQGIKIDCRDRIIMLPTEESDWQGSFAWLNFPGRMGAKPNGIGSSPGPTNIVFKSWFFMQPDFGK